MRSTHKRQSGLKISSLDSIEDTTKLKNDDPSHIVAPDGLGSISLLGKIGEGITLIVKL